MVVKSNMNLLSKPSIMVFFLLISIFGFFSCSTTPENPVNKLRKSLIDVQSYSIMLEDMKTEGMFSKRYFHKYRVVQDTDSSTTGWEEVSEKYYRANENYLGMVLISKVDGVVDPSVSPPGYNYVGNSQYGKWVDDGRGGSFWEFYGKYAFFSHLFGGWYRPIYRTDYGNYSRYKSQRRPYFGRNNEYGSKGSIVKQKKPNFYERKMAKTNVSKKSFSNKVSKRVGRSRTSYRGRSGSWGK